jgi:hypothetical protein
LPAFHVKRFREQRAVNPQGRTSLKAYVKRNKNERRGAFSAGQRRRSAIGADDASGAGPLLVPKKPVIRLLCKCPNGGFGENGHPDTSSFLREAFHIGPYSFEVMRMISKL